MNLAHGSEISNQFNTSIGLITSRGVYGDNIMACEWTHHISYDPGLIAISVNPRHATHDQIKQSGEFGVGICAQDQSVLASAAGKDSGRNVNKIKILEALGFLFYPAEKIQVLMARGTAANFECRVVNQMVFGDHTMFIGEVLHATNNAGIKPLVYHAGSYWLLDNRAEKPSQELRDQIKTLHENNKK